MASIEVRGNQRSGSVLFYSDIRGDVIDSSPDLNILGSIRARPGEYQGEIYNHSQELVGKVLITNTDVRNMVCFVDDVEGKAIGAVINSREVRRGGTTDLEKMTSAGSISIERWTEKDVAWLRDFILFSGRDPDQKFPVPIYPIIERMVQAKWKNLAGAAGLLLDIV